MLNYYPIASNVRLEKVLIVGAGAVAQRKAKSFLNAGALVKMVSPVVTAQVSRWAVSDIIVLVRRRVRRADVSGARLVIAATDDAAVNRQVSMWARQKGIPVNVVDCPELSDFISPAVFRSKRAILAVYTDGRDPVLSRDLKNFLKERWNEFIAYRNRLQRNAA